MVDFLMKMKSDFQFITLLSFYVMTRQEGVSIYCLAFFEYHFLGIHVKISSFFQVAFSNFYQGYSMDI